MWSSFSWICVCILVLPIHKCAFLSGGYEERTERLSQDSINRSIYLFGTELMKRLDDSPKKNVLTSPLSAYISLSMLHLGANRNTRNDLNEVLKISKSNAGDLELYQDLSIVLQKVANKPYPYDPLPEIILSNELFVDKRFPIHVGYNKQLKYYYGGNATAIDINFRDSSNAFESINERIRNVTKNRIGKFFSESLSKSTDVVLTSALCFEGTFQNPFNATATFLKKFANRKDKVPMMSAKNYVPYYNNTLLKFSSIELPFKGGEYAMMIILPHSSQKIRDLIKSIHQLDLAQYRRELREVEVEYSVPKMNISFKKSLFEALKLKDALKYLELRNMTSDYRSISMKKVDLWQAAEMEVNENGTTRTANKIERQLSRGFTPKVKFEADQPFIIHIVHKPTYIPLLSGVINNPAQK